MNAIEEHRPTVLVYMPLPFNGQGPAESCARMVEHFAPALDVEVYSPRVRSGAPANVRLRTSSGRFAGLLPWRFVRPRALRQLDRDYRRALDSADPAATVAYFWPTAPAELVRHARKRGIMTVREMINTPCGNAAPLLEIAGRRYGLPALPITAAMIADEVDEIHHQDFFFASNPLVETALEAADIPQARILSSSFGWDPARFHHARRESGDTKTEVPRVVFAGILSARKGVPDLLAAWRRIGRPGELVLAGRCDDGLADYLKKHLGSDPSVRAVGFRHDLGALFGDADIFVLPTWEEGGPQVTYEAAACRLPIITTPMGAARLVETGVNGIIVEPGAVERLADAIRLLLDRPELRRQYGAAAQQAASAFTYPRVGAERAQLIREAHARFHGSSAH